MGFRDRVAQPKLDEVPVPLFKKGEQQLGSEDVLGG